MQDFKCFSDLHDLHALHGSKIFTLKNMEDMKLNAGMSDVFLISMLLNSMV